VARTAPPKDSAGAESSKKGSKAPAAAPVQDTASVKA
jgi:hypothetical protein